MTLKELLAKCGVRNDGSDPHWLEQLDLVENYELMVGQAGERTDEVVAAELVHQNHTIYLEYD